MAQRVAAMDVRMVAAVVGAELNVSAFCSAHGISRQTFYKWRRRFAAEGLPGLAEQSRAALSRPGATPAWVEDEIVRVRKQLGDFGADHGPDSIRWALLKAADRRDPVVAIGFVPSRATIARVLTRRGMVVPAPRKRPKSSLQRFVYARPNECWQSDWTSVTLADGTAVAVAGTLDDHSRLLVAILAAPGDADSALVWAVMLEAITGHGPPMRSLTDNGMVYSLARRDRVSAFEANLRALGTQTICSSPYHPGTCGKIERFWQTLKRWLFARDPAETIDELNTLLAVFAAYYNQDRPHRALRGQTPAAVYAAAAKARPVNTPLPVATRTIRARVDAKGEIPLDGHIIGIGRAWAGRELDMLRDGDHVLVLAGTELVRDLHIDPNRRGQPRKPTAATSEHTVSDHPRHTCQR